MTHLSCLRPIDFSTVHAPRTRVCAYGDSLHLSVVTFGCDALDYFLNLALYSSRDPSSRGDVVSAAICVLPIVPLRDAYVSYDGPHGALYGSHLHAVAVSCFDVCRALLRRRRCRRHRSLRDVVLYDGDGRGHLPGIPLLSDDASYDNDPPFLVNYHVFLYAVVTSSDHATHSSRDRCLQIASAFGDGPRFPPRTFLIAVNPCLSHL